MPIAVGIDLVGYEEIEETLGRGDRYLRRIYTDEELDACGTSPRLLAACFAAKEATMKALSRTDQPIPWRSIELRMRRGTQPSLELTGAAADVGEVTDPRVGGRIPATAVLDHRRRDVDPVRLAAELRDVSEDPAGAAAHLERPARQDLPVADQDYHLDRQQPAVRVFGYVVATLPGRGVDLELIGRCQRNETLGERARSRCARARSRSRPFSPSRSARTAVRAAQTRRPCRRCR